MIDVICYGLGPIGARIARRVLARPGLRLAGAVDIDPAKVGRDVADVIGADAAAGVTVVARIGALPPRDDRAAVAVHTTSSLLTVVTPQLEELARAGYNVVSTCEELSWPWDQPDDARRIDEAARAAGVSVLGAGINPGFLLDVLPLVLTSACVRVQRVRVRRVVDTDRRRVPLQQKAGVGMTVGEFRRRAEAGMLGHVGLRQSAALLADGLGWRLDSYRETLEPALAERDTDTGLGRVPAGDVLGQRQVVSATAGGREVIRFELDMIAGADQADEVEIDGDPSIRSVVAGGINGDVGTEAVIANLIPVVASARAGLLTMRDLMPLSCSAEPVV